MGAEVMAVAKEEEMAVGCHMRDSAHSNSHQTESSDQCQLRLSTSTAHQKT